MDREVAGCKFQDARLSERFRKLLKQIGSAIGQAIPFACQDWANTKAAYRFFSNDRVDEEGILSGHFEATHDRFAATDGYVLVLHDTTEFSFKREKPELIGSTRKVGRKDKKGRITSHTVCGILMHSSLVVITEGLPLGLAAIKFWVFVKSCGWISSQNHGERPVDSGFVHSNGCSDFTRESGMMPRGHRVPSRGADPGYFNEAAAFA